MYLNIYQGISFHDRSFGWIYLRQYPSFLQSQESFKNDQSMVNVDEYVLNSIGNLFSNGSTFLRTNFVSLW